MVLAFTSGWWRGKLKNVEGMFFAGVTWWMVQDILVGLNEWCEDGVVDILLHHIAG